MHTMMENCKHKIKYEILLHRCYDSKLLKPHNAVQLSKLLSDEQNLYALQWELLVVKEVHISIIAYLKKVDSWS